MFQILVCPNLNSSSLGQSEHYIDFGVFLVNPIDQKSNSDVFKECEHFWTFDVLRSQSKRYDGKRKYYDCKAGAGDWIEMEVDTINGMIDININNENKGIAFKDPKLKQANLYVGIRMKTT